MSVVSPSFDRELEETWADCASRSKTPNTATWATSRAVSVGNEDWWIGHAPRADEKYLW